MTEPSELVITQADRDAWELYGSQIFHGDRSGPECLAHYRQSIEAAIPDPLAMAKAMQERCAAITENCCSMCTECIDAIDPASLEVNRADQG